MPGLGTLINALAIVVGGVIGLALGTRLTSRYQTSLIVITGVCVLITGIAGTIEQMIVVVNGHLKVTGILMMIVSFALGTITGELLDIEKRLENFGSWLKAKSGNWRDVKFVQAFLTSSLTVCIGAMAVIGAIKDGMQGDITLLEAKALLDFIIVMVMAASLGKGCLFSAIPVFIFQGTITLLARWIEPYMTQQALSNIALTGSIMIFCVGVNLVWGPKVRIANTLPTLIFAVIWTAF